MQQRRPRLGDILDDYCPRERRITNHAVVAMIDDQVKQTRCTTCDADHEYKSAKAPPARRKKPAGALFGEPADAASGPRPVRPSAAAAEPQPADMPPAAPHIVENEPQAPAAAQASGNDTTADAAAHRHAHDERVDDVHTEDERVDDEGPVHRPLIRATLPRPEGHTPERKAPDFTMRQPGGRFNSARNGQGHRGPRQMRAGQAQHGHGGQPSRFGGQRPPGQGVPHGQRHGNRPGQSAGQRDPRGGGGQHRGQRPGGGQGRKRGR